MRAKLLSCAALVAATIGAGAAHAQQTCTSWPVTLTAGATASASDVMADLNCAATYGLGYSSQNVGVGTTYPSYKFDVWIPTAQQPNGIRANSSGDGHWVSLFPSMGAGNWNPITQAGDEGIIYTYAASANGSAGNAGLVIAPWNSTLSGIRMNGAGQVGIGTASPAAQLDVVGEVAVRGPNSGFGVVDRTGASGGGIFYRYNGVNRFWDANYGDALSFNGSGQVAVDTAGPPSGYAFYVNGSAAGSAGWANLSDARLKQNVVEITGALGLVERLRGVRYNWRPAETRAVGKTLTLPLDKPQIGFIAQEVAAVVPEAVTAPKDPDGVYSLKEADLIPVLVQAIKEQQAQIAKQESEIAQLRDALAARTAGQ